MNFLFHVTFFRNGRVALTDSYTTLLKAVEAIEDRQAKGFQGGIVANDKREWVCSTSGNGWLVSRKIGGFPRENFHYENV